MQQANLVLVAGCRAVQKSHRLELELAALHNSAGNHCTDVTTTQQLAAMEACDQQVSRCTVR